METLKQDRVRVEGTSACKPRLCAAQAADRVKLGVVREFGVPLLPPHEVASATISGEPLANAPPAAGGGPGAAEPRANAVTVRKAAGALLKHRDTMPPDRRR